MYSDRVSTSPINPSAERFKLEELEIENKKLREHLDKMRAAADSVIVSKQVIGEYLFGGFQKSSDYIWNLFDGESIHNNDVIVWVKRWSWHTDVNSRRVLSHHQFFFYLVTRLPIIYHKQEWDRPIALLLSLRTVWFRNRKLPMMVYLIYMTKFPVIDIVMNQFHVWYFDNDM